MNGIKSTLYRFSHDPADGEEGGAAVGAEQGAALVKDLDLGAHGHAPALAPVEEQIHAMGDFLRAEHAAGYRTFPPSGDIFNAFRRPMSEVKVLIIGQDPYPTPGTAIVAGSWAEVDVTTLTDEAAITAAAQQLAAQGAVYAVVPLKDTAGSLYYASQVPAAAGSVAANPVDAAAIARVFKANGITPVAQLAAFRDPAGARADHAMAIRYKGQEYLWLDNKASAGGNPWLNPYAAEAVQYIGDLIEEVHGMGFDQVLLKNVQFPSSTSSKQDYGSTNGVDRAGQLAADIAAWQSRFGTEVTLWYGYSLSQVTDATSALGVPAAQLGMKNLLVEVPGSSTLDEAGRTTLTRMLEDAGVEHTVIRDDAAGRFE